jgi:hypothetical protein
MASNKKAPYGSRKIAKLLRRQGPEKLAAKLGVSVSTVKRYARDGVPKRHRDEVRKAVARSDRSYHAAQSWREIAAATRFAEKKSKDLLNPVEQIHYDPITRAILGTRIVEGDTITSRVILQRHRDSGGRWVYEVWFANSVNLEGYTPEDLWHKYEKFQQPGIQFRIEWGPGSSWFNVHGAPQSAARRA